MKKKIWIIQDYKNTPIEEVWETIFGDLYFFSEKMEDGRALYVRLYNMPQFAEWGSGDDVSKKHILSEWGNKIWKVHKKNWGNINSYEKNLLNEIEIEEEQK